MIRVSPGTTAGPENTGPAYSEKLQQEQRPERNIKEDNLPLPFLMVTILTGLLTSRRKPQVGQVGENTI